MTKTTYVDSPKRFVIAIRILFVRFLQIVALSWALVPSMGMAQRQTEAEAATAQTDALWEVTWDRFYSPKTHLFYDYLTSYQTGKELSHLPTVSEIKLQSPNECGYDTGMEDGMISAGVMMSLIVDRYAVTGEEELRERADAVFQGIRLCATAHGADGFIARAVSRDDLKSIYPNSSRDQYTHAVHALWLYARSPLCSDQTKTEIGLLLSAIADRMTRNVIAENNYDSLRADGSRDTRGISRMWNVQSHEAARLPMIYAATWEVTGMPKYFKLYQKYLPDAIQQSLQLKPNQPTYALLQMQASMELLLTLERDEMIRQDIDRVMQRIAAQCSQRAGLVAERARNLDLTMLCSDWRTGEGLSATGRYRPVWYCIRESGEAALTQLLLGQPLPETQQQLLYEMILRIDPQRVSSSGIFFLQAAYWKDRHLATSAAQPVP